MKKRAAYASITFTPTEKMRRKILELMKETGHPATVIVMKCVNYALEKAEAKPIKKDIFFRE